MKVMTLKRITETDDGTFGILFDESQPFCLSLERKWLNNKVSESCIPLGEYTCQRIFSPKFKDTFEVCLVPGRTEILFHKGNLQDDSHGCILVAESFGYCAKADGIMGYGIIASGDGFSEFKGRLNGMDQFKLVVVKV